MAKTSGVVQVSSLHRTEVFVSRRSARLTVHGRRLLVECLRTGRPWRTWPRRWALSRATAHKWVRRRRVEGEQGLPDCSSRPRTTPHRTTGTVEAWV
ncbi:leucine zipper domain-containing protein [Streptomyces sp. NPDC060322]|uniref:leucine zipper domain-containing protein n=1 Tax=Streptomyces sp. NPDC060322 TaxID=3347097 RepID=UPI00364DF41E